MAEWFRLLDLKSGGPWFKSPTLLLQYLDLLLVVPSSTPRLCCVNSQLVSLPPVGILIVCVLFEIFVYLFMVSPVSTAVLNTLKQITFIRLSFFSCLRSR